MPITSTRPYPHETAVLGGLSRGPVRKSIHYSQLTIH